MSRSEESVAPVAVVVGGAGALGRAVVEELRGRGDRVVAVDRAVDSLADLPHEVDREAADVTSADNVDALFERLVARHGRIDTVVHTVGTFRPGSVIDSDARDWQLLVDLNLNAAWWVSRAAARVMQPRGRGAIVHIGARNAVEPTAGSAAYGVTKAALVHLTRVLDAELRSSGVRVNAVLPGVMDTPANRDTLSAATIGRAVPPTAIAKVIAFLAGDDAAPVSGAIVPVYGTA